MANVVGGPVLGHVQAFANECSRATGQQAFSTYEGHSPHRTRALDIFVPTSDRRQGDAICEFAKKHYRRFGIDYVIFRRNIWNPEISDQWRYMEDRGSITANHVDHVHISFEASAPGPFDGDKPADPPPAQEEEDMSVLFEYKAEKGYEGVYIGIPGLLKNHVPTQGEVNDYQNRGVKWLQGPAVSVAAFHAMKDVRHLDNAATHSVNYLGTIANAVGANFHAVAISLASVLDKLDKVIGFVGGILPSQKKDK